VDSMLRDGKERQRKYVYVRILKSPDFIHTCQLRKDSSTVKEQRVLIQNNMT
jgi:hypothetical protein